MGEIDGNASSPCNSVGYIVVGENVGNRVCVAVGRIVGLCDGNLVCAKILSDDSSISVRPSPVHVFSSVFQWQPLLRHFFLLSFHREHLVVEGVVTHPPFAQLHPLVLLHFRLFWNAPQLDSSFARNLI